MKRKIFVFVILISCFWPVCLNATIYYDIDFSSPEHTVGQPPAVGPSITTPSEIVFGEPIVSESLGLLNDQPLVFNCLGNSPGFFYDQIQLNMDSGTGFYYTSFDVTTQNLIGSRNHFVVLFDMPGVRNITFKNDGKIDLFFNKEIDYQDNQLLHFQVLTDIAQGQTSILVNGDEVYNESNGFFGPGVYLKSIRFSLGLVSYSFEPDNSSYVGLDNIFVSNFVPEPTTILLLGLGGLFLKRRKS